MRAPRFVVTAFLLTVGLFSTYALDIAAGTTYYLCYDEASERYATAVRFDGPVEVVFDPSVGASTRLATLNLLPRVNALIEPGATLGTVASISKLYVYVGPKGRANARAAGFAIPSGPYEGYNYNWSTAGRITRACLWLSHDIVDGIVTRKPGQTCDYATLVQELTQALGPTADSPGGCWSDGPCAAWLIPAEQFALMFLYRKCEGGESAVTIDRNARAFLLSVASK